MKRCKYCGIIIEGNAKKVFCSDSCRIYSHRDSKWVNINELTEEQCNKLKELWKTKQEGK